MQITIYKTKPAMCIHERKQIITRNLATGLQMANLLFLQAYEFSVYSQAIFRAHTTSTTPCRLAIRGSNTAD